MSLIDNIKCMFSGLFKKIAASFSRFIQRAIPPAKQVIIMEFKEIASAVVAELALENLTSEAKRLEAFKRIKDKILESGKDVKDSLVNLLIELAYSEFQELKK